MKRKTDRGSAQVICMRALLQIRINFFKSKEKTQEQKRKEMSRYLLVIKKQRKQTPPGFFVSLQTAKPFQHQHIECTTKKS